MIWLPAILVLILVLVAVLGYLFTLPAEVLVRRSLDMNLDQATIFAQVRDLRRWPDWSPWLLHEPDARLDYSAHPDQEGGHYSWDGRAIGTGRLTQVRLREPDRIDQEIRFTRPFKSTAAAWWEFAATPDGATRVTWCMRARLPLALRFLTGLMTRMIEQDYELGLARLRGTLDPDAERPQVRFQGPVEHPAQAALTIPYSGDITGLIAAMQHGFPLLTEHLATLGVTPAGPLFTAYHEVDTKALHFACDLAVPVPDGTAPGTFTPKRLGGGRYFATELKGSYAFLGPVWSSTMAHLRMYRIRWDRARPALEVYVENPSRITDTNDLTTRILVPIR